MTKANLAGAMPNALYIPSIIAERNIIELVRGKLKDILPVFQFRKDNNNFRVGCGSSTDLRTIPDNSIDYIFVDPPFGSNLMYSELSFIWDAWLKILTNNATEAIMSVAQRKGIVEYQSLFEQCFKEFYTQVKGTHTPIVTEEEFARVQEILAQKSIKSGKGKNARKVGHKPHSTVWGRLMICQCGKRFNMHFHERKDRDPGVDYQCYTSVNRGSQTERQKRGLSMEGTCDTPFIPGWKMEMMASHLFKRYIKNADDTLQLAYALLEQHIDDQEELPDNSDAIRRKQSEIDKLNKKLANLIEMREDGDIEKEYFRERKKEIESKIGRLAESIKNLTPLPPKDIAGDYSGRLAELKKKLSEYTDFDGLVIPESIVEAFIQKIWVSKDEFRWYLRTNRSSSAEDAEHIQIGAFTLTLEDAKSYQYSFSTRKRIYNWEDLNVTVWI
ncbi:MAG: hypothetical protein SPF50_00555 [Oscillospiraceae bacterium]|nr:hypothetical protein [Oscillospiraceae bacterium]